MWRDSEQSRGRGGHLGSVPTTGALVLVGGSRPSPRSAEDSKAGVQRAGSWEMKSCPRPPGGWSGLSCQQGLPARSQGTCGGHAHASSECGWDFRRGQHPGSRQRVGVCPLGYLVTPRHKGPAGWLGTFWSQRGSGDPGSRAELGPEQRSARFWAEAAWAGQVQKRPLPRPPVRQQVREQVQEDEQQ